MNDDPSRVNVLYAKVESDVLQKIADGVYQYFVKSSEYNVFELLRSNELPRLHKCSAHSWLPFPPCPDIAKQEYGRDYVKLHMTLINTRYSLCDDDGQRKESPRQTIDARQILERLGDFDFGTEQIDEIHLAIMKTEDPTNGFYKCSTSIRFWDSSRIPICPVGRGYHQHLRHIAVEPLTVQRANHYAHALISCDQSYFIGHLPSTYTLMVDHFDYSLTTNHYMMQRVFFYHLLNK